MVVMARATSAQLFPKWARTSFFRNWMLICGESYLTVAIEASAALDMSRLQKALDAVFKTVDPGATKAVATVYEMLGEDPSLSPAVLRPVVAGFTKV